MVKRTETREELRSGRAPAKSALGPRGRGLLGRLFGSERVPPAISRPKEAVSVAIASGKGGTGKSFLATNLAVLLNQQMLRVTLVDCDFGLACNHLLLGVTPKQTLSHLLAGQAQLEDILLTTPSGPQLVPGGSGIMQMADLTDRQLLAFASVLGELASANDVLLLDVGAGIAPQVMLTLLAADHVVVVTQPEIAALTDAYAVIKCCARLRADARFSVVVNRVLSPGHGEKTFEKLREVTRRHVQVELQYLGEIPEDSSVTQRRLNQKPVVLSDPDGATARAIHGIVQRLQQVEVPLARRQVDPDATLESRFREHRLFLG
ncbi:MAG: P-loop NTPase [Planctomycetes bacterium]|nr:P-loop NTPase [Planctomycetota bacterium]MCB9869253.1 P-loop NTPase [Planctomycetota bacterium]MCB9889348.1 P-loop NTPase [Planctomycetota bacterium]